MAISLTRCILCCMMMCFCLLPGAELLASDQDCTEAHSTAEMRSCANARYQAADAELNRVYRQLMNGISQPGREQLKAAQQAWLGFRDKNAAFVAAMAGEGTMAPLVEIAELTTLTRQRVEQLKRYLKEGGN